MSVAVEIDFVKITRTDLGTSSRTLTLQVKGFGATGDDGDAESVDAVEFAQPLGVAARPTLTANSEAIIIRRGDEAIAVVVLDKSGPVHNVEAGGVQLYGPNQPTAMVYIRANGNIEITPKSGQVVKVLGGTTPVAVEGSRTAGHTHPAGSYVAGPYAVTSVSGSSTDTVAGGQGAQNFWAPAAGT